MLQNLLTWRQDSLLHWNQIGEHVWDSLNEELVFTSLDSPDQYSLYKWRFLAGKPTVVYLPSHSESVQDIALNQQGTRVAIVCVDRADVWTYTLKIVNLKDSLQETLVAHDKDGLASPTWSPDGRRIAFIRQPFQVYEGFDLVFIDVSNGDEFVIKANELGFTPVRIEWSPVGDELLVTSLGLPGSQALYLLELSAD